jgi:hypothetical protein
MMLRHIARMFGFAFAAFVCGAAASPGRYQPRETFAPFDIGQSVNRMRSGSGLPGPHYWQNRADYRIRATLDVPNHSISGTVDIHYTNNSPDKLDVLWLQVEQNRYLPESRGNLSGGTAPQGFTSGMSLDSVTVQQGKNATTVQPLISDTRAQLRLPAPLAPHSSTVVHIRYHSTVPKDPRGGRTGWMNSANGEIYSIAQWYPRVAVYDDVRGWDTPVS